MSKRAQAILLIALTPVFLVVFTIIHESGHTLLARLFGDSASTFYLVKIDEQGTCLGCNITDHTKLSYLGNVVVSVGGLLFTQASAIAAFALARFAPAGSFRRRALILAAFAFAFLDVVVQGVQGLAYDTSQHTWPTGVDLMDFMLLIGQATGLSQNVLKSGLAVISVGYLAGLVVWYRRGFRKAQARGRQTV